MKKKGLFCVLMFVLLLLTACNSSEEEKAKEELEKVGTNEEEPGATIEAITDMNDTGKQASKDIKNDGTNITKERIEMDADEFQFLSSARVYIAPNFENGILTGNPISGRYVSLGGVFSDSKEELILQFLCEDGRVVEYVVSVFPDSKNPNLALVKEKYTDLTYEEDEKQQSIHWVINNIYTRINYYLDQGQQKVEKDRMIREGNKIYSDAVDFYNTPVISPSYLYHYTFNKLDNDIKNKLAIRGAIRLDAINTDGTLNIEKVQINTYEEQLDFKDAEQMAKEYWDLLDDNAKKDSKIDYASWSKYPYKTDFKLMNDSAVYYSYE